MAIFGPGMPEPLPDDVTAPFWEACRERRLVVQRCSACGTHRMNPSPVCGSCQSFDYTHEESRGVGEVFTYTIIHHPAHPATADAVPYNVAVIQLADCGGVKLISNVVDCPPDRLHVGMAVELIWDATTPDLNMPRFRPIHG